MASEIVITGITENWVKLLDKNIVSCMSERVNTVQKRDGRKEYGGIAVFVNLIIPLNAVSKLCWARFQSKTIKVGGILVLLLYISHKPMRVKLKRY